MRPLIALAIVAGFVVAAALLSWVGPNANEPVGTAGGPIYHSVLAPGDFLATLPGEAIQDLSEPSNAVDSTTWLALVAKLHGQGPEALSDEEWKQVIWASWWTLLMQENTVKYHFTDQDPVSGQEYDLVVAEKYQVPAWPDVKVPVIAATGTRPSESSTDQWTSLEIVDLSDPDSNDPLISTSWDQGPSGWECSTDDISFAYSWWEAIHFQTPAVGSYLRTDSIDGRKAYEFGPGDSGTAIRLWLDAETLLPLQFEATPSPGAYSGSGYSFFRLSGTFKITEVNGDVNLDAPSTCLENYKQPAGNELTVDCQKPPDIFPPDPFSTGATSWITTTTNEDVGHPENGGRNWISKYALDLMGRVCGFGTSIGTTDRGLNVTVDVDYYGATPGAIEGFKRRKERDSSGEAAVVSASSGADIQSLGEERLFSPQKLQNSTGGATDIENYLLFRRRNLVVLLEWLSSDEKSLPVILQYALQLDQNIEAAAQQGG